MAKRKATNWDIKRLYKCTSCGGFCGYIEPAYQDFTKDCPNCGKPNLLLESADSGLNTFVDQGRPSTIGMIGSKNAEECEKGNRPYPKGYKKKQLPFWRKNKKIDFDILKKPNYIIEGK